MTKADLWCGTLCRRRESGLSAAAFCRREGLKASQFHYWKKKLSGKSFFTEVWVADHASVLPLPNDLDTSLPTMEIILLCGDRIRLTGFSSWSCLVEVIAALRERPC